MLFGVVTPLALLDALVVARVVEDAREYRAVGASTWVVELPDGVSGDACAALTDIAGVQESGAISSSDTTLTAVLLPGSPLASFDVTEGLLRVLDADADAVRRGGILLSETASGLLDVVAGDTVVTDRGVASIAGGFRYPDDGRRPGLDWSALAVVPDGGSFDACWTAVWPPNAGFRSMLPIVIDVDADLDGGKAIDIGQLNTTRGERVSFDAELSARATRWAVPAAALLATTLAVVGVRLRRLDLAARLHDRMRRDQLCWLVVLETFTWAFPAAVVVTAVVGLVAVAVGAPDALPLLLYAATTPLVALLGAMLGAAVATLLVRESHLFRLFKGR